MLYLSILKIVKMIEVVKILVMTLMLGRVLSREIKIIGNFNFSVFAGRMDDRARSTYL